MGPRVAVAAGGRPGLPAEYFWNNGQFGYSDAVAYNGFLRSRRPRTVLEIGSGFSTLVADAAMRANGEEAGRIVCIEPYPRPFLEALGHVSLVVREPVQKFDSDWINDLLQDRDVLFIDSTHTVKIGSDCVHLFLRLLPALRRKLLIHVQDIYLPDGMPDRWAREMHVYWTEQYLLMAYLIDNPKVRTLWASHYLARSHLRSPARDAARGDPPRRWQLLVRTRALRYEGSSTDQHAPVGIGKRQLANNAHCMHCWTCDIKDPHEIIDWVWPEGGARPRHQNL